LQSECIHWQQQLKNQVLNGSLHQFMRSLSHAAQGSSARVLHFDCWGWSDTFTSPLLFLDGDSDISTCTKSISPLISLTILASTPMAHLHVHAQRQHQTHSHLATLVYPVKVLFLRSQFAHQRYTPQFNSVTQSNQPYAPARLMYLSIFDSST
jgi:hypothetical protein